MLEVREDLSINKDELDVELSMQPSLFYRYSEMYSDICEKRDIEKIKLEQVKSATYSSIKSAALEAGKKITEKALEEEVNSNREYIQKKIEYVETCKQYNTILNIMEALKQKQKSISKLCDLFLAGYYYSDSHKETSSEKSIASVDLTEQKSVSKKVGLKRKRLV